MYGNLAGPLIGALIGYCTNYIAVKMLFYPKKEIRIGNHRVPFTPGAIPKGKPRLAKAIGAVVSGELLTEEDIRQKMISEDMEHTIVDQFMKLLSEDLRSDILKLCPSQEAYDTLKQRLSMELTNQILDSVHHMNLEEIIVEEAKKAVKEKTKGSMLEMFLSDDLLTSLIQPMGKEMIAYIDEKGPEFIGAELDRKISSLEEMSVMEIGQSFDITEEVMRGMIAGMYHQAVDCVIGKLMKNLDISGMIEEKINAMNVADLEKLVLTVMKKELDMIVNLGALVGGVLGILNIFL